MKTVPRFLPGRRKDAKEWHHRDGNGHTSPICGREAVRYGREMSVLIAGGGIAGLTLAGLLQQRGFRPHVVERVPEYGQVGYIITLWPAGSRILKGLDLYPLLERRGVPLLRYTVANDGGQILRSFSTLPMDQQYGPILSFYRPELVDILRRAVRPEFIRMGTTIEGLEQSGGPVHVTFSDGDEADYDLVVGCDGIHSRVRRLAFGSVPLENTNLTIWAFWAPAVPGVEHEGLEYWGAGRGIGLYPTWDRLCAAAFARSRPGVPDPVDGRIARIRELYGGFGGHVPRVLDALDRPEEIWHDDFSYVRMQRWHTGRVVLAGDAAHAVPPTIGVGASLAIESAAVLAEELCRTDSRYVHLALAHYEARRRPRVSRLQNKSSLYDRVFASRSMLATTLRDRVMTHIPRERFLGWWEDILAEPI